jgi:hypothetical protein
MGVTAFVLLYHFAIATPGFGAPVHAETVGPLSIEQCEQISATYRRTKPGSGRNDVACIRIPNNLNVQSAAQWYSYLHRTYLEMANCVQAGPGQSVSSTSAVRIQYTCSG